MNLINLGVLLFATVGAQVALADSVVSYNINFTVNGTGTLPTAGSFTYDSTTSTFVSFSVTFDGYAFNLTDSANAPMLTSTGPPCLNGATGGAATFALLNGACTPPPSGGVTQWVAQVDAQRTPPGLFVFVTADGNDSLQVYLNLTPSGGYSGPTVNGQGGWTLAQVPDCSSLASSKPITFDQDGGSYTVNFTNPTQCEWLVMNTNYPPWVTLPASSGTGPLTFSVPSNIGGPSRTGKLTINGNLSITVTQTAVCALKISDSSGGSSQSFTPKGGMGAFSVNTPAGCNWTAVPSPPFITITSNASGTGPLMVTYSVASNTTSNVQSGVITVAGLQYVITEQPAGGTANSCSVSAANALPMRPEGSTEKVADIVFTCSGQVPPAGVTGDVLITFNAAITNRLLTSGPLVSAGETDALLLEDEPTPTNVVLGTNAFRGFLTSVNGGPVIRFPQVPLALGGTLNHTWRVTNLRVSPQTLAPGSLVQATVAMESTAPFTITNNQIAVASIAASSKFAIGMPSTAAGQTTQPVSFTEGFDGAFKPGVLAGQDPSQVGTVYDSESGYVNTAALGSQTGFATNGTRLTVAFLGVPAGVSVYAPLNPTSGNSAGLVSADFTGTGGPFVASGNAFGGAYQLINLDKFGAGTATWEVRVSNPLVTLTFNLIFVPNNAGLTGITYAGALTPLSIGLASQLPSTNLPVPNFAIAPSTITIIPAATVTLSSAPQAMAQAQGAALKASLRDDVAPSNSAVGGAITWIQVQTNTGAASASAAPNVAVGGTLPPTWVIIGCTALDSGGTCPTVDPNNPSNFYTATYPSLSPGQTGTIMLTAQSASQSSGSVEYTSGIDSDLANTDLEDGSFTVNFPVSQIGLNVSLTHASNFAQGQMGVQYSVTVANGGSLPTSLPVTVTETLPPSLTLVSMSGTGWTCTLGTASCTRSDVLAANSSYPSITVTVNVASNTPSTVTNQVAATTGVLLATGTDPTNITQGAGTPAAFFNGEASLGSGVYYLQFPNGNLFGYYNLESFPIFYHYDLGFEAFVDGVSGAAFLFDFTSKHWWYTSSTLFPYLYDFTLNNWLYYFQDTKNPGHYTSNPRYFSNLTTGQIFTI